jgi:hypothetical protein
MREHPIPSKEERLNLRICNRWGLAAVLSLLLIFAGPANAQLSDSCLEWTSNLPANRIGAALAYDSARGVTVLFGGRDPHTNSLFADTWEWNGTSWNRKPISGPGARYDHALAYDAARSRIVLFGGHSAISVLNDTWEYDGS